MEKLPKEKMVTHFPTTQQQQQQTSSSSRSSSRRTSGTNTREALPTPPPDPRLMTTNSNSEAEATVKDNIFQYPTIKSTELSSLPGAFQGLLQHAEREQEFYKSLNEAILKECKHPSHQVVSRTDINKSLTTPNLRDNSNKEECQCQKLREECEQFMNPLNGRLNSSVTAALAAYGAVDQLTRLYSMWDRYLDAERQLRQRRECLRYVNLLNEKVRPIDKDASQRDGELDTSLALLDTILATGTNASLKRSQLKQQRERSKSVMIDDVNFSRIVDSKSPTSNLNPPLLRRQSTYSDCKSKVSKWTKVKAAFKWEKANVPALNEGHRELPNGIGLTPVNNEVARYLRVPSMPCGGGSSADSILSSSSGHILSETGTPGTISSASSMDDIVNSERNTLRRDSSKSDSRSETNKFDDYHSMGGIMSSLSAEGSFDFDNQKLLRSDSNKSATSVVPGSMAKSSSNKSFRKSKIVPDFEVLHEEKIAEIIAPRRRLKPPPSPLDLNLKQDLQDSDYFYSPHMLKSPKDGTQSLNRLKKLSSPGNSSVPSSPSRHSDFFVEFESEDISSGDFSEPSSPSRKNFQQKQQEINLGYHMLREKLDMEFAAKQREWEKIKANPNATRAIPIISNVTKSEEHSPNAAYNPNLSTKQLEQNLTPDFKKKLKKWRVKKQTSLQSCSPQQSSMLLPTAASPNSPSKEHKESSGEAKSKIDWNLWKTGQLKLEGQGLKPLPDQKDLPEDFQKKLEQWNKIKRGGGAAASGDSLKRNSKHNEGTKKSSDDDRGPDKEKRADKHKTHEKDKLEKLSKLKAIVGDHPTKAKEIEVKTSVGVMKFEGISRKFTRKLYEWEKARGIGPESSTFALLHPGYCPIDVGRISKDNIKNDNSPTLSRSLSLDSVSHNIALPAAMSHQASSLSLNDVNEFKSELDGVSSCDQLEHEHEFKKFEEPEAVMVEVEDDIVETASPLITANSRIEKQTPVYKYEEVACNDICNSKRIQSYESHTNLAPLLSALKRFDELFEVLKKASPEIAENEEMRHCQATISLIRNIYPYYTENLTKANVLNAISDVQSELSRLTELHQKSPLDEACCQEMLEERNKEYSEEFEGLQESLHLLRQSIQGGTNRYPRDIVPDINITTEDATNEDTSPQYTTSDTKSREHTSTAMDATDEMSASQKENDTETTTTTTTHTTVQRSFSNATTNGSIGKKKLRLRKMGSRQNSKTESSNSSDEDLHGAMETPRRLKRKNFRFKQRSFDDDFRRSEEPSTKNNEDVHYVLKVKPGHPIEQCESVGSLDKHFRKDMLATAGILRPFAAANDNQPQLGHLVAPEAGIPATLSDSTNVFVKTKRKVFTTVEAPTASDGIAVLALDIDSGQTPMDNKSQSHEETIPTTVAAVEQKIKKSPKVNIAMPVNEVTAMEKTHNSVHKSLSQSDLSLTKFSTESFDERKSHSAESLKAKRRQQRCVRQPLASDSFRLINKSYGTDDFNYGYGAQKRMELRFKKNPNLAFIQHPRLRKIETRIAKSNSGASVESSSSGLLTPNSVILRKPFKAERNSLTPTLPELKREFSYPSSTSTPQQSAPTTPLTENPPSNKPCTPLSERAQRLRKAKEDFLQGTMPRPKPSFKRRDEIIRTETWEQYRRSDHSLSSVTTTGGDDLSGLNLLKSLSSDTIRGSGGGGGGVGGGSSVVSFNSGMEDTPAQSDAGTDLDISVGVYDSLPRTVTRSGKISSKLGFANLASKFRRVKVKGKSKDTGSDGGGALSTLCRQTLFTDVLAVPENAQQESVMKSQSTPQARVSPSPTPSQVSHLNKSQSEQYVRHSKKESYV